MKKQIQLKEGAILKNPFADILEVRRLQKIAGLISEVELGEEPDQLEEELEEDDYDEGTPSGDTDPMNIAEDDFSATMHAVEDDPVV